MCVLLRCACKFEGNNPKNALVSAGSGAGTVEDFKDLIADDAIVLGLVKVVYAHIYRLHINTNMISHTRTERCCRWYSHY